MSQDIQSILKDELRSRQKLNTSYSLRAFSRDLKLSPGYLSDLMNGKKKVSVDTAITISNALGWGWRDTQVFMQMAQLSSTKSKFGRRFIKDEIKRTRSLYSSFTRLKHTQFSPISDWYFFAIMELSDLPDFTDCPEWIGKRLGISVPTASHALKLLKQHGFIFCDDGVWKKKLNSGIKDAPSADLRKFHRQHLRNAEVAIEEHSFETRRASGTTMAISTKNLPAAFSLITEFRARMSALLEDGEKDAVYHLAVQLFQLDKPILDKKDAKK